MPVLTCKPPVSVSASAGRQCTNLVGLPAAAQLSPSPPAPRGCGAGPHRRPTAGPESLGGSTSGAAGPGAAATGGTARWSPDCGRTRSEMSDVSAGERQTLGYRTARNAQTRPAAAVGLPRLGMLTQSVLGIWLCGVYRAKVTSVKRPTVVPTQLI